MMVAGASAEAMDSAVRPRIAVTRLLPGGALERLRTAGHVVVHEEDRPPSRDELLALVREADGLLCLLTERIDAEVLDAASRLRVVSNYAVGVNNVDVAAATRRGILVTNTPDVLTEATADFTWALILAACRRLGEGERLVRAGAWRGWSPTQLLGADVYGTTLGIVGLGRIGRAVARRAAGFAMPVLHHTQRPVDPAVEQSLGARPVALDDLLRAADVVSLHVPYTPATHHLVDAARLHLMKPSAFLINTARGPLVDEAALVEALRMGVIAGAGLDVYEREPALAPGLAELPNVVLAPHLGSATVEARSAMADLAAENLLAGLAGRRPPHPVNSEVLA
jgi:glyoxylate reductase